MYDISTKKETQITTGPSDSLYPAIYGDRIVWDDNRNGNWDVYVYDLATGQECHTTDKSDQYYPAIYGDRIVWTDMRNGNPDIYMGTLSSASFSASPTTGKAPLNVAFTDKSTGSPTSWEAGDHIVTTVLEHHSNLLPWLRLQKKGVKVTIVSPDSKGKVDISSIEKAFTEETKLVAINQVSNVFGSVQDVKNITKLAHRYGIKVLVDGAQSAGHMPVSLKDLNCDFFATAGHKGLLGPQGTGVLYIKEPDVLDSASVGGGTVSDVEGCTYVLEPSPACFEAGTPNIPGVIGLGRAVEYVEKIGVPEIEAHD